MKYPKVNKKELSGLNKAKFDLYLKKIKGMLQFDNKENQFNLSKKDVDLISWNCAVNIIFYDHLQEESYLKNLKINTK
jgi:hypothetical protein